MPAERIVKKTFKNILEGKKVSWKAKEMDGDVENGCRLQINPHGGQGPARTVQPAEKKNLHLSKDFYRIWRMRTSTEGLWDCRAQHTNTKVADKDIPLSHSTDGSMLVKCNAYTKLKSLPVTSQLVQLIATSIEGYSRQQNLWCWYLACFPLSFHNADDRSEHYNQQPSECASVITWKTPTNAWIIYSCDLWNTRVGILILATPRC